MDNSYAKQNWKKKEHKPPNEVPALRIDENVMNKCGIQRYGRMILYVAKEVLPLFQIEGDFFTPII